jgi:hypothetical protein
MNRPLSPEVLLDAASEPQMALPLAAEGTLRWVWRSRYGDILIEVQGDRVFVNGEPVEPHRPSGAG